MKANKNKESFWTSYSDLMTSLFFVMLVLFIVSIVIVGKKNKELTHTQEGLEKALANANVTIEEQNRILQLDSLFSVLSNSTALSYDNSKKIFYAKDFVGIEIFYPEDDIIKDEYKSMVDNVGRDIEEVLSKLNRDKRFHYQLVIEGTAAIHWKQKKNGTYNPDSKYAYELSYRRALALYNRWKNQGINLRQYNTEIIIAGSGFNGNNRDKLIEENNKRFLIQIIPKIQKPTDKIN